MRRIVVACLVFVATLAVPVSPTVAETVEANWNRPTAHWKGDRTYSNRTATVVPVINRTADPDAVAAVNLWNNQGTAHLVRLQIVQTDVQTNCDSNVAWHIVLCSNSRGVAEAPGSAFPASDPTYFGHMHHCRASVDRNWEGVVVWLHEIGHCLGLGHHHQPWGGDNPSVMGGRQSLGPDDYWGIVKLYWHNDSLVPRFTPTSSPYAWWGVGLFLQHVASGQVVDVPYGSYDDGTNLTTYPRHGGPNQQYVVEAVTSLGTNANWYRIVNVNSQKVLALDADGVTVEQQSLEAANADPACDEWWYMMPLADGTYGWYSCAGGQFVGQGPGGTLRLMGNSYVGHGWRIVQ
jgi:hypothetical protein